ncbi:DoxX family protein [Streptomyces sp. NPDC019531]|uniref:DoxX family protein n=1 Tax=Streptomyces sp. NPDC019531 TaxID=3365062 RepID=UPI00384F8A6D
MHITLMITGSLFGGLFFISGSSHLAGATRWCTPVGHLGFSARATRAIGVFELAGGAGLLAGLWFPLAGIVAAGSLFLLTTGALQYHHWYQDKPRKLVPAALTALVMLTHAAATVVR